MVDVRIYPFFAVVSAPYMRREILKKATPCHTRFSEEQFYENIEAHNRQKLINKKNNPSLRMNDTKVELRTSSFTIYFLFQF